MLADKIITTGHFQNPSNQSMGESQVSEDYNNRVSNKLDTYDRFTWIKRVLKIHRTMVTLEQHKHLKPFMSQAVSNLMEILFKAFGAMIPN
jgi:hypothetical protein